MTNQNRCSLFIVGALLLGAGRASAQNNLTDISVFGSDSSGSYTGFDVWGTRPSTRYFGIFIQSGASGGPFLNGPDNAHVQPNIPLSPGSSAFRLFADPGVDSPYFGINLFFNGSSTPSISAYAPMLTSQGGAHTFSANSSPNTVGELEVHEPGSGALSFTANGERITLTDFYWAAQSVYNQDQVSRFTTGADGMTDYVGGIQFSVTQVPEPGLALWALGSVLVSAAIWRKADRRA